MSKKKTATLKQVTALKLINEGVGEVESMKRAGYAESTARNPKTNLLKAQAITNIVEKFIIQLKDENITTAYLAKKYKEWLDAQEEVTVGKGENAYTFKRPDYVTQLQAGKLIKEVFNLTPTKEDAANLSRRVTLEEYLNP